MNVITENAREGLMNENFYADDLVLIRESMESLREKVFKKNEALGSKGLKVDL